MLLCSVTVSPCSSPVVCGNDTVYCEAGSSLPMLVPLGSYSTGIVGLRSGVTECAPGTYCPGDGRSYPCPAGYYGESSGLTTSECSGVCDDGVVCDAGSKFFNGRPCPTGQYCVEGISYPCPAGSFNDQPGASNVTTDCVLCPAGRFNRLPGAWDASWCSQCPSHESSLEGATVCWPGVIGSCF